MTDNNNHSFRHGLAFGTSKAIDRFKTGSHGDLVTREQMQAVTGESCELGTNGYGHVNTAIKHVETTYGIVWRWDRNRQAWRCLDDAEKVHCSGQLNKAARRKVSRSLRVAASVDESTLDNDQHRDHQLNVVAASLALTSVSAPLRKRLDKKGGALVGPDYEQLAELVRSQKDNDAK